MVDSNNAINNTVGAEITGVTNTLIVTNPSDTASSAARTKLTVGGSSSADPTLNFNVNSATDWEMGIDNSDLDKFKLSNSAVLGTDDTFVMTTDGQRTMPLQSFFFANLSVTAANATGDGTAFIIFYDNVSDNINSDYNPANGIYTAPEDGVYFFSSSLLIGNFSASHTTGKFIYQLNSAEFGSSMRGNYKIISDAGDNLSVNASFHTSLTAGDAVRVEIDVIGGAKTVNVVGSTLTNFNGGLLF